MTNSKNSEKSIQNWLFIAYLFYFLGFIESITSPYTNGILMVIGLIIVVLKSDTIKQTRYKSHVYWLVISSCIFLAFSFIKIKFPIGDFIFNSQYIGLVIYFYMISKGLFALINNKPLMKDKSSK